MNLDTGLQRFDLYVIGICVVEDNNPQEDESAGLKLGLVEGLKLQYTMPSVSNNISEESPSQNEDISLEELMAQMKSI